MPSHDPPTTNATPETKAQAESLLPLFQLSKLLSQDQHGRRINLLGTIYEQQAVLTLERAAFPSDSPVIATLFHSLIGTRNLGANDIYRWYMSNSLTDDHPNIKVNLIWPCTESHIRKYATQKVRYVTETPEMYSQHIKPWIARTQRTEKRVGWIYNILDGITEQEDVVYRSEGYGRYEQEDRSDSLGFVLLPDLNWDRRSVKGLHLLALVERRDLWSLRSLRKRDIQWLKRLREEAVRAAAGEARRLLRLDERDGEEVEADVDEDQFKCYVHYQPTYYHFHVHVVHVMLEAGATQATGKAFSLDLLIQMLEILSEEEESLEGISVSYTMGEESELWKQGFSALKKGDKVTLNG